MAFHRKHIILLGIVLTTAARYPSPQLSCQGLRGCVPEIEWGLQTQGWDLENDESDELTNETTPSWLTTLLAWLIITWLGKFARYNLQAVRIRRNASLATKTSLAVQEGSILDVLERLMTTPTRHPCIYRHSKQPSSLCYSLPSSYSFLTASLKTSTSTTKPSCPLKPSSKQPRPPHRRVRPVRPRSRTSTDMSRPIHATPTMASTHDGRTTLHLRSHSACPP